MNRKKMWHLLPGQYFPMTLEQESEFVQKLKSLAAESKKKGKHNRDDLTLVLTALRCGSSVESMLSMAQGSNVSNIYAAYLDIENKRLLSYNAWLTLTTEPTIGNLNKNLIKIKKIMPYIGSELSALKIDYNNNMVKKEGVESKIKNIEINVKKVTLIAEEKEREITLLLNSGNIIDVNKKIEIGTLLYDPISPGIYGNNFYLPERVSTLTPVKIRDLLGEHKVV